MTPGAIMLTVGVALVAGMVLAGLVVWFAWWMTFRR